MAADESKYPLGPFKLVTVNNAPERAKRLIGRVVEEVKGRYTIVHAGNADSLEAAPALVKEIQPDLLFTASMWTAEESLKVRTEAATLVPGLKTFAIPKGLQVEKGPDAIVEFLVENLPALLEPGTKDGKEE
ncbi:hypothetical protein BLS_001535 [Venturia inaequalis]|uniref:Uncharacterized protein n=1 Tax=Venturia inaequalis TaxID=5025 RepID=A0A8H3VRR0_VENIN|nr:hypothetical protein BLS_001535 [Venturia inaequalis]KAE9984553.1 hypothetical protein EG328_008581 [Venturia inaequalis]KAE9993286.1 hypothetical protein EG327_005697 [Venturia inaequalis]